MIERALQTFSEDTRGIRSAQARLEERAASLQSVLERTSAGLDRLHAGHAGLQRVASSLPLSVAALTEEVHSLRAAHAALQHASQAWSVQEPQAADATLETRIDRLTGELGRLSRFVLKVADDRPPRAPASTDPLPQLDNALPIDAQFAQLEAMVPRTFGLWKDLLEFNRESYSGFPVHSCSVNGHPSASLFTYFVNQFLRGYVLDIGCGPQPVPLYLQQYPADHIFGIDPISNAAEHPFRFYQGVAEFLPWNDGSFDVAIAATSLDHVLFLDKSLREIHRVLKEDGEFLVWVAFVAGSPPYDPCSPDIQPVDEFHLFHFTEPFFEGALSGLFSVKDKLRVNLEIDHHFYRLGKIALAPEADSASAPAETAADVDAVVEGTNV